MDSLRVGRTIQIEDNEYEREEVGSERDEEVRDPCPGR